MIRVFEFKRNYADSSAGNKCRSSTGSLKWYLGRWKPLLIVVTQRHVGDPTLRAFRLCTTSPGHAGQMVDVPHLAFHCGKLVVDLTEASGAISLVFTNCNLDTVEVIKDGEPV